MAYYQDPNDELKRLIAEQSLNSVANQLQDVRPNLIEKPVGLDQYGQAIYGPAGLPQDPREGLWRAMMNTENVNMGLQQQMQQQDIGEIQKQMMGEQLRQTQQDLNIKQQAMKVDPRYKSYQEAIALQDKMMGKPIYTPQQALELAGFGSPEEMRTAANQAARQTQQGQTKMPDINADPVIDQFLLQHQPQTPEDFSKLADETIMKWPDKTPAQIMRRIEALKYLQKRQQEVLAPPPANTAIPQPPPGIQVQGQQSDAQQRADQMLKDFESGKLNKDIQASGVMPPQSASTDRREIVNKAAALASSIKTEPELRTQLQKYGKFSNTEIDQIVNQWRQNQGQ